MATTITVEFTPAEAKAVFSVLRKSNLNRVTLDAMTKVHNAILAAAE